MTVEALWKFLLLVEMIRCTYVHLAQDGGVNGKAMLLGGGRMGGLRRAPGSLRSPGQAQTRPIGGCRIVAPAGLDCLASTIGFNSSESIPHTMDQSGCCTGMGFPVAPPVKYGTRCTPSDIYRNIPAAVHGYPVFSAEQDPHWNPCRCP